MADKFVQKIANDALDATEKLSVMRLEDGISTVLTGELPTLQQQQAAEGGGGAGAGGEQTKSKTVTARTAEGQEENVSSFEDVLERLQADYRGSPVEGIAQCLIGDIIETQIGPQTAVEHLQAFRHAVRWTEPLVLGLLTFHIVMFTTCLFVSRRGRGLAPRLCIMILMGVIVLSADRLNDYGARHWQDFSTHNYFDRRGIFVSIMVCAPLLVFCFLILAFLLREAAQLRVQVKTTEAKRKTQQRLVSAFHTSAPREQQMEACAVLSALITSSSGVEGDGPFFSEMFKTLVLLFRWFMNSRDDHYDSPLVLAVTTAFSSISKRIQQPISSDEAETVVSMIYFILRHERDAPSALEYILLTVLHLCVANKNSLIRSGVTVAAIDAMGECGGIATIYEVGSAILARLSASRSLQEVWCIVQTGGIDVLVSALSDFPDNKRIQRNACEALSHLTIDQEARMLISSQGGVLLLTMSMASNRDCVALQERACVALQNIIADSNDPLESSVIEAVVAALSSYPDFLTLQESAIGVLQLASSRSTACRDIVIRLNGIEAILTTARAFVSEPLLLEYSFGALRNLASAKERIVENDGIQLIINGMLANIGNDRVQENGCGCLGMLASSSNLCSMIRDAGGVRLVILALRAHYDSETTVCEACVALANLASSEFEPQDSEIDSIVTTMNRYRDSVIIQDYGCRILRGYLPSSRNREHMLAGCDKEKMESVLKRALSAFPARCSSNATVVLGFLGAKTESNAPIGTKPKTASRAFD